MTYTSPLEEQYKALKSFLLEGGLKSMWEKKKEQWEIQSDDIDVYLLEAPGKAYKAFGRFIEESPKMLWEQLSGS